MASEELKQRKLIASLVARYGDKLDFSKTAYTSERRDRKARVTVTCPSHGDFTVSLHHLRYEAIPCRACASQSLTEQLKHEYLGKMVGVKKIVAFHGMRLLVGKRAGKNQLRLWEAECQNCKNITIASIASMAEIERAKAKRCKVCKGRRKGETGLRWSFGEVRRTAKMRHLEFSLSIEEYEDLASRPCHYCGADPQHIHPRSVSLEWSKFLKNGIDRKDNDVGYVDGNCLPCCTVCNTAKMAMTYDEFAAYLDRLVSFRTRKT